MQLSDGQANYIFFDENTAGRMMMPSDLPSLADSVSALYFGGISLACEPAADAYAYAALLSKEGHNRVVMIDPNVRPSFIEDAQRYRTRLTTMIAKADIVKISDEDLECLSGEGNSQNAKSILEQGPSLVILTRGSAGSTAYLKNGNVVEVAAEQVSVVDTVGAGDTFNAGVLARLSELGVLKQEIIADLSPDVVRSALQFGAKIAAINVSRAGANPPWVHEL